MNKTILFSMLVAISIFAVKAQSPMPVIVPAMTPAPATAAAPQAQLQNSESFQSTIKMLQEMKASNDEMLKKQEAMLSQLDELEKAADQLKIFSKRG